MYSISNCLDYARTLTTFVSRWTTPSDCGINFSKPGGAGDMRYLRLLLRFPSSGGEDTRTNQGTLHGEHNEAIIYIAHNGAQKYIT